MAEDQIHSEDPSVQDQQEAYPRSGSGVEWSPVARWWRLVEQCVFHGSELTLSKNKIQQPPLRETKNRGNGKRMHGLWADITNGLDTRLDETSESTV